MRTRTNVHWRFHTDTQIYKHKHEHTLSEYLSSPQPCLCLQLNANNGIQSYMNLTFTSFLSFKNFMKNLFTAIVSYYTYTHYIRCMLLLCLSFSLFSPLSSSIILRISFSILLMSVTISLFHYII